MRNRISIIYLGLVCVLIAASSMTGAETVTFTYDNLNRLTLAAYGDCVIEYTYDSAGNILNVSTPNGGADSYYRDADDDGYGTLNDVIRSCYPVSGYVTNSDDCDDTKLDVNPDADETCNGLDDNCDGQIDEGVINTYYADTDEDGFGDLDNSILACDPQTGYVVNSDDCDDSKNHVNPDADETCNGLDDNCDGQIDEGVINTYYADTDDDGFGDPHNSIQACDIQTGYVVNSDDCEDEDQNRNPDTIETCNGEDDNCDGLIDEGVKITYYLDSDADGYGDPNDSTQACSQPEGYVTDSTDCYDDDSAVNPGALEACGDGIDNNCDGNTNEDCFPEFGLVAYYPFDGDATDHAGEADGTEHNGVSYDVGKFGQAANFDGIDDKISVADSSVFNFDSNSFTISMWLSTAAFQPNLVIEKHQSDGNLFRVWGFYDSEFHGFDGDSPSFQIQSGPTSYAVTGTTYIYDGDWHHVCLVRNNSENQIHIYINGALENSTPIGAISVSSPSQLVFGGRNDISDYVNIYSGLIDDARFYNRAISPHEIQALFNHTYQNWYKDFDGDGYSDGTMQMSFSRPGDEYYLESELTAITGDCDDGESAVNPDAVETCNNIDDNCDDQIDEGVTNTYYLDSDNDGFGDINSSVQACVQPSGYSTNDSDCNDDNPDINPDAEESCNGVDDNCNNETDEGCKPYVETKPADSIKATSAVIKGLLNPNGESTTCYFEYGISSNYTNHTTTRNAGSETGNVNVRETLYSLYPDTEYFYRLVATSIEGTTFGNELSFSTEPVAGDTIYTEPYGFCDGLDPCFSSIQDAIDSAENGMVIRIGCGIFYENVIIDKNITLEIGWDEYFSEIPAEDPVEIRGTLP